MQQFLAFMIYTCAAIESRSRSKQQPTNKRFISKSFPLTFLFAILAVIFIPRLIATANYWLHHLLYSSKSILNSYNTAQMPALEPLEYIQCSSQKSFLILQDRQAILDPSNYVFDEIFGVIDSNVLDDLNFKRDYAAGTSRNPRRTRVIPPVRGGIKHTTSS